MKEGICTFLEWMDVVVDIREQYPLDIERTKEIANQLGINHAHIDGIPVVMTTDFVLTLETPKGKIDIVRTVKPANKLSKRTLELFEIERRYFSELGVDWCIILENRLPKSLIKNVEWMCEAKYLETRPSVDEELIRLVSPHLYKYIEMDGGITAIGKICLRCDRDIGLEPGTSMFILQYHLVHKHWVSDMNVLIRESKPILIKKINTNSINSNLG